MSQTTYISQTGRDEFLITLIEDKNIVKTRLVDGNKLEATMARISRFSDEIIASNFRYIPHQKPDVMGYEK